jgi:methyl-accepting chemotaxis protein
MGDFSKAVHIYGEEVLAAEAKQEKLRLGLLAADKAFNSAREGVEDLADAKSELAKIEEEGLARRKRIEAGLLAEADAMAKLGDALGIVTASQLEEEARAIEDALQDARDATLGFSQELSDLEESASRELASLALRTQSVKDGLGDMGKAAADAALGFTKAAVAIDKTGDAVDDTGDSFDDLSRSVRNTNSALSDQARQAQATGRELTHLTAISETLALAEARTALAATKEARKNITGVGSQNRDNSTGKYGLSEFGTGGRVRVNPDGTLRPA